MPHYVHCLIRCWLEQLFTKAKMQLWHQYYITSITPQFSHMMISNLKGKSAILFCLLSSSKLHRTDVYSLPGIIRYSICPEGNYCLIAVFPQTAPGFCSNLTANMASQYLYYIVWPHKIYQL